MELYKPQVEALAVLDTTKESKGIVQMATGTGKTYLAAIWFKRILEKDPNANLLFICHNRDILKQANDREFQNCLKKFDLSFGYYIAANKDKKQVTFATVQTLYRNLNKFKENEFDYIVVDECHHYKAITFEKALSYFKPKFMLGLSATAYRADGKSLENICGKIIYKYTIYEGRVDNILAPFNYYWVNNKNSIRYMDMKLNGTKCDEKVLNREVCKPKYDNAIISEYEEYAVGVHNKKKTICFCVSVKHTERMVKVFNDRGIKAVGLTGMTNVYTNNSEHRNTTTLPARERILDGFRNGDYDVICVVDLFNEGVDVPDADCIMMIRPTYSSRVFTQQIGRGLRKAEGKKDLLILDFTASSRWCSIVEDFLKEALNIDVRKEVEKIDIENNHSDLVLKSVDCDATKDNNIIQKDNDDSSTFVFESLGCSVILSREKVDLLKESIIEANKYSFESLKKKTLDLAKKLGRTPTLGELGIHNNIFKRYSGFSSFVKQIGLKPIRKPKKQYTNQELITLVKDKSKELGGKTPTIKELGMDYYIFQQCGGFSSLLEQIGLKPIRKPKKPYTESELEKIIKDKAKELGRSPKLKELRLYPKVFKSYGGFSSFLKQIGLKPNQTSPKHYTESELEKAIKDKTKELGRTPTLGELGIYAYYFTPYGGYFAFLKQHGMNPSNRWSRRLKSSITINTSYTPKVTIPKVPKHKANKVKSNKTNSFGGDRKFNPNPEKDVVRKKIVDHISDGDVVLLLESPKLLALKEIDEQGIKPSRIIIPNHIEPEEMTEALQKYDNPNNIKIEFYPTSILQFISDHDIKYDFVWLDYCGGFSNYYRDIDALFIKDAHPMKLVTTYSTYDPRKDEFTHYFVRAMKYIFAKTEKDYKFPLILDDVSGKYNKLMYQIGIELKPIEIESD